MKAILLLTMLFSLSSFARYSFSLSEEFPIKKEELMPYLSHAGKLDWLGPFNHFEKSIGLQFLF